MQSHSDRNSSVRWDRRAAHCTLLHLDSTDVKSRYVKCPGFPTYRPLTHDMCSRPASYNGIVLSPASNLLIVLRYSISLLHGVLMPRGKIHTRLLDRREKLAATIELLPNNTNLKQLLVELDAALDRATSGRYGICKICNEPIENHLLEVDPLLRFCFSHLEPREQTTLSQDQDFARQFAVSLPEQEEEEILLGEDDSARTHTGAWRIPRHLPAPGAPAPVIRRWRVFEALEAAWEILSRGRDVQRERDLEDFSRASLVQSELLPASHLRMEAWEVYYDYVSAGPVGGDYCDLVPAKNTGELFLLIGDAMGKGIAASIIASKLHAIFRALLELKLPIDELLERANRIFCECVLVTGYYATLVCGRAFSTGTIELINAGHLPPLLVHPGGAERLVATGVPLGLFYASKYEVTHIHVEPGETLLFYTDGVTEARNSSDTEYGPERLARLATERGHLAPKELVRACRDDVSAFTSRAPLSDDLTLLALRRV
jgi:serine phosphatase RsbU (regulator of sigma subunit)/RNA polymerase-binding transcription factor DksA